VLFRSDQWHSGWSLLLCSVACCLGVGACSQADYPGMFGCICGRERQKICKEVGGRVVCCLCLGSIGGTYAWFCGAHEVAGPCCVCVCGSYPVLVSSRVDGWSHRHPCASPQLCVGSRLWC
jgi:hypothetical protein